MAKRTSGGLSLAEVTTAALENNPAIKEALRKWNAAKARITQAAAWDDPRVGGESRVRRFVDVPPNAFMDQSASIEQAIPITGKNLARGRAAKAEAISAYAELRRQQLDVIAATRAAFFRLANAHAQIDINQKNIVSMRQIADISRTKFEAGTHSAADVLVAETEASKLLEAERDLERQLSEQESQLNTLMNRDAFTPIGVANAIMPTMPELSPAKLRPLLFAHRPEIKMAEAKIDTEKAKLQLAQRAWVPDPALIVKVQRYNDAAETVSELDAGVSFTVPWINFKNTAPPCVKRMKTSAPLTRHWSALRKRRCGYCATNSRKSKRHTITSSCFETRSSLRRGRHSRRIGSITSRANLRFSTGSRHSEACAISKPWGVSI